MSNESHFCSLDSRNEGYYTRLGWGTLSRIRNKMQKVAIQNQHVMKHLLMTILRMEKSSNSIIQLQNKNISACSLELSVDWWLYFVWLKSPWSGLCYSLKHRNANCLHCSNFSWNCEMNFVHNKVGLSIVLLLYIWLMVFIVQSALLTNYM